jgi:RecG-like helicase
VGREPEVAAVASFLGRATQNSPVMLVEGEIGIGKTSVLAAARDAARERGWLVLTANPAELEMPLEYTGIADLLDPLPGSLTETLPGPQRRAIRVALLREEAPRTVGRPAHHRHGRGHPAAQGRPLAARSHDRR